MKSKFLALGIAFGLLTLNSCKKDEVPNPASAVTVEETVVSTDLDNATDDVMDLVQKNSVADDATFKPRTTGGTYVACADVSRTPAFGTKPAEGSKVTKTIKFNNCEWKKGITINGTMVMTFTYYDPADILSFLKPQVIDVTFQPDFTYKGISIVGTKKYNRTFNQQTIQPKLVVDINFVAKFPNSNVTYTRTGYRTFEYKQGFQTLDVQTDDRIEITGSWSTTSSDGKKSNCEITSPLYVDLSCVKYPIVKGTAKFSKDATNATLDYGNGDCDNLAVLSVSGLTFNIAVGK